MNKYIYDINIRESKQAADGLTRLVLSKLDDLDINKTELNSRYLKASHGFFRS